MDGNRKNSHSVSRLSVYIELVTKYCYHVLTGDIQVRYRDLIIQMCNAENAQIIMGVVSKDHIHEQYPASLSISVLVKKLKGRTSRHLQQEFPALGRRY